MAGSCGASPSRLDELLAKRSTPGIDPTKIDRKVWKIYGETTHVLVVALAGQARRIAAFDVVHELQLQFDLRLIFEESVRAFDGVATTSQMGPHTATFAEANDALEAAMLITRSCAEHNAKRSAEDALPACVGIGYGHLVRTAAQVHGREQIAAMSLATDASEAGQVLVTQAFLERLGDHKQFRVINLSRAVPGSPDNFRVSVEGAQGAEAPGRLV